EAEGRAELVANRQRADQTTDKRRAEWLEEYVCAIAGYGATQNSAGSGTPKDQRGRDRGLDAEDYRERYGTRRGGQCEKPRRSGWRRRDCGDCLQRSRWRKPTGADLLNGPCRRGDALHVHTGRVGRHSGCRSTVLVLGLNLQFSPPRHDLGAQSQRTAELLGRSHRLLGGLPVDVQDPAEAEDELGALLQGHVSVLRSAHWKRRVIVAGSSPSIRAQPRKSPMLKTQPWSMRRSPHMASPFSSDRRHGRIRPR